VFVEMDESSIFQVTLAVGRLTQINLNGKVTHVAFSDFERFRFDYKDGMIFASPGTKDAALVDWRKVRTDLAVVLDDGRQYHFEFVVVDPSRASHRVVNVNAPPPRRALTAEEIEARLEAERSERERREAEISRKKAEEERARDEALGRAAAQPLVGRIRKGPFDLAVARPIQIDSKGYVRFSITNRRRSALPVTVSIGSSTGLTLPADVRLPMPIVGPKGTLEGIAIYEAEGAPPVASLSLFVTTPGEKPVELRLAE